MKNGLMSPSLVKIGMLHIMMMKYWQETPILIAREHIQMNLREKKKLVLKKFNGTKI